MALDLENSLNWNIRLRQTIEAETSDIRGVYIKPKPIPPITVDIKSALLLIGIGTTQGKPTWYTGAYANLILPFLPGSTSQFRALSLPTPDYKVCKLGFLNLLDFTEWYTTGKKLQLGFPRYFKDVYVEIWEYSESRDGVFKPAANDKYSIADDINALRFYLEGKEVPVTILNSPQ